MSTDIVRTSQPRTLVLMSPQALFDTLALEVGRDLIEDIEPTDHVLDFCNKRSMARPQHVDEVTLGLMTSMYGPALESASNEVEDAADALPATQAINVIDAVVDIPIPSDETEAPEPVTGVLVEVDGPVRESLKKALDRNRRRSPQKNS